MNVILYYDEYPLLHWAVREKNETALEINRLIAEKGIDIKANIYYY